MTTPFQDRWEFEIDPFRKRCLLEGLDEIDLTLAQDGAISAHEAAMADCLPFLARPQAAAA